MTADNVVNDIKSLSILSEFSECAKQIQLSKNPMEAAEVVYDCITTLTSADLFLMTEKVAIRDCEPGLSGAEPNLIKGE